MNRNYLVHAVIAVVVWLMTAAAGAGAADAVVVKPSMHAQERYTTAARALRAGDYARAGILLEQIVSEEPEISQYHYALSMAYSSLGDFQRSWQQLRQTLRLNPQHKEAERDIDLLWQLFGEHGLFNVGTADSKIQALLGSPDHSAGNAGWQSWRYAFWLIEMSDHKVQRVLDMRGIDPKLLLPLDDVEFFVDEHAWIVTRRSGNRGYLKTEYLPPGQTLQNWTELFSTQHFLGAADQLAQLLESQRRQLFETDPDSDLQIVDQRPGNVLYEWHGKTSGQYLLTRMIAGVRDVHQLTYAIKTTQPAAATRALWIDLLKQARLSKRQPDIFLSDSITYLK
jgi:hypothetical protein